MSDNQQARSDDAVTDGGARELAPDGEAVTPGDPMTLEWLRRELEWQRVGRILQRLGYDWEPEKAEEA